MAKSLKNLIEKCKSKYSIAPLIGEKGLYRTVSWVYVAEDIDNIGFIKSHELIITTGYFTDRGTSLYDFVSALIDRDMSGLIINTGKYITEIPEDVKKLCSENSFPIFTMPWEIHLTDVMQELCSRLLKDTKERSAVNNAFITAIKEPDKAEGCRRILNDKGFSDETCCRIINIASKLSQEEADRLNISEPMHIMEYEGSTIIIAADEKITGLISKDIGDHRAGISSKGKGCESLHLLYKQACDALKASKILNEKIVFYDNIGILSIIFAVENKELLKEYSEKRLKIFEAYDKAHGSNLTDTLYYYLKTGGSLTDTAEIMFTHRNTIGYRMNKIKEISGKKFDTIDERFEYIAAIYIKKALEE